jgi:hypothetical protein
VLTETQEGGCDLDRKWRYEIRNGESWTSSDFVTALHFNDSSGLEICGYEEDDGTLMILDPAVELWSSRTVEDGAVVDSGEFSVTASVLDDLVTYYGVFSKAVAFDIEGPVDGLTARLVFVSDMGLVLVRTHEFTADLVYVR